MEILTEEQKRERRKRLDLLIKMIDEDNMRRGWPPTKVVDASGTFGVTLRRQPVASTSSSKEEAKEKPISEMSPEEFREKAKKALMENHGYSREQAEATVNSPY